MAERKNEKFCISENIPGPQTVQVYHVSCFYEKVNNLPAYNIVRVGITKKEEMEKNLLLLSMW